ncbi:TlpA family protein disulfide reductase [Aromatoleum petrolei]|uniref:Thioredoxin domain-containing protein n=1 Tax=Aromatoleum petrolei TaxID=76116 RepID=A0ABX1MI67_9RHOO|nr:hypothetical protein [Aromatoleum petrolei]NMF87638.1 hypothetical protein [Aromatoleum petrolei]QTQ38739.1 Uncharacterized protein ToN1_46440 [Aromatoleum petrolei]
MKIRNLIAVLAWSLAAATAAAEFQTLDRAAAARIVNPASHTVPTIVALWSSECIHCKKNLKLFSQMAKGDHRFRLVTVAVEAPFAGLAEPLDLLSVPGQRFAYGGESPEALGYALDPKWRGELPRTIFFDGKGGKSALSGVVTEATVRSALGLQAAP